MIKAPPPPGFFVSVHSKGLRLRIVVSAVDKGLRFEICAVSEQKRYEVHCKCRF